MLQETHNSKKSSIYLLITASYRERTVIVTVVNYKNQVGNQLFHSLQFFFSSFNWNLWKNSRGIYSILVIIKNFGFSFGINKQNFNKQIK